ncbi:MAG: redoxin domain-containing protein [Muribaculaceae bacterium]|nr:redoxin domain-containing protein [Muribaculaceae bacterium]
MIKKLLFAIAFAFSFPIMDSAQTAGAEVEIEDDFEEDGDMIPAPDFTLKDLQGKDVSLTSFQGDWVILDFWGSWCKYCLLSFPNMKEAYAKYHPLGLEIIGIDCNESEEAWRQAVKALELPWVSLYNPGPKGGELAQIYQLQGYPTYVVINPEGYIYEYFLGETPEMYELLRAIYE